MSRKASQSNLLDGTKLKQGRIGMLGSADLVSMPAQNQPMSKSLGSSESSIVGVMSFAGRGGLAPIHGTATTPNHETSVSRPPLVVRLIGRKSTAAERI